MSKASLDKVGASDTQMIADAWVAQSNLYQIEQNYTAEVYTHDQLKKKVSFEVSEFGVASYLTVTNYKYSHLNDSIVYLRWYQVFLFIVSFHYESQPQWNYFFLFFYPLVGKKI